MLTQGELNKLPTSSLAHHFHSCDLSHYVTGMYQAMQALWQRPVEEVAAYMAAEKIKGTRESFLDEMEASIVPITELSMTPGPKPVDDSEERLDWDLYIRCLSQECED